MLTDCETLPQRSKKDGSLPNPNQRYTLDDGDVTIHHFTCYIGTPVGCKKNQVANLFTYMYKYERSRGDIWWSCNLKAMGPFQAYRRHAVGAFRHLQAQLWLNLNCWIVLLAAKWRMISLSEKKITWSGHLCAKSSARDHVNLVPGYLRNTEKDTVMDKIEDQLPIYWASQLAGNEFSSVSAGDYNMQGWISLWAGEEYWLWYVVSVQFALTEASQLGERNERVDTVGKSAYSSSSSRTSHQLGSI